MATLDAPQVWTAMAAHTQESIPPLRSTTAFSLRRFFASSMNDLSNAFCRRIPHELVQLHSESVGQAVGQHPFHQLTRFKAGPLSCGAFEHWRKQNLSH